MGFTSPVMFIRIKGVVKMHLKGRKGRQRKEKERLGMYHILLLQSHIHFLVCPCVLNIFFWFYVYANKHKTRASGASGEASR